MSYNIVGSFTDLGIPPYTPPFGQPPVTYQFNVTGVTLTGSVVTSIATDPGDSTITNLTSTQVNQLSLTIPGTYLNNTNI